LTVVRERPMVALHVKEAAVLTLRLSCISTSQFTTKESSQ